MSHHVTLYYVMLFVPICYFSTFYFADNDPCTPNYCQNGGICNELTTTTYDCTCAAGYAGTVCDTGKI